MNESFVQNELSTQVYAIMLVRGFLPTGEHYYAYLSVRLCNLDEFAKARKENEFFEPSDYGLVLMHGLGEPTHDVMAYMEDEYGFDHSQVIDV